GAIDDMDTVWCNGTRVGGMEGDGAWSTPRSYVVPAAVSAGREAMTLVVRVVDTGGEGGFVCEPEAMRLSAGGEVVPLSGGWERQRSVAMAKLPAWPRDASGSPNRPAVLWNGMIAPLVPFPFAGAIWYQGESNRGRAEQYSRLFPAMIEDWRAQFDRPLPFHFVQIAPYAYDGNDDATAALRLAQAAALALPRTGMAVTLDIGNAKDIHPRNKQEVGRRLALQARRVPYGEDVVADGPSPGAMVRDGAALRITFTATDGGLLADAPVTGFQVAGADGRFVDATARIDGDDVILSADAVEEPVQVRYAWASVPAATLRNGAGLPAAPFVRALSSGK
ncbi:MAG: 9-O-acetylesterase, partial [Planctomycetes bacterium]|nr:9-O-acetylesterase [Planctomycetota bacterium]